MFAAQIGKAIVLGTLGYAFPRFLIALGLPLDKWIEASGADANAALWGFALIFLLLAFWLDGKYNLFERMFYAARPVRLSKAAATQFIGLLDSGAELLNDIAFGNVENHWSQRVVAWNAEVETLVRQYMPERELIGYRTLTIPPQAGQPVDLLQATLDARRNKLRLMTTRLLPAEYGR